MVEHYCKEGLVHFNIWLFSLVDQGSRDLRRLVPKMSDAMPAIIDAAEIARSHGATLCSLNTPHCMVPPEHWSIQFDAAGMDLAVVNPGGHVFMLEESSIEQGVYIERCQECTVRQWCHGMRSDYLQVHGDEELIPVTAEVAAGADPQGSVLAL